MEKSGNLWAFEKGEEIQMTDIQSIAIAHLSMIAQAASGEYEPRPGEIEERQAWLTEFILTGKGIVSEAGRLSAQIVNNALKLSAQPSEAANA